MFVLREGEGSEYWELLAATRKSDGASRVSGQRSGGWKKAFVSVCRSVVEMAPSVFKMGNVRTSVQEILRTRTDDAPREPSAPLISHSSPSLNDTTDDRECEANAVFHRNSRDKQGNP